MKGKPPAVAGVAVKYRSKVVLFYKTLNLFFILFLTIVSTVTAY
jgi:hypothetical protein